MKSDFFRRISKALLGPSVHEGSFVSGRSDLLEKPLSNKNEPPGAVDVGFFQARSWKTLASPRTLLHPHASK
jgi:hypothetical protein